MVESENMTHDDAAITTSYTSHLTICHDFRRFRRPPPQLTPVTPATKIHTKLSGMPAAMAIIAARTLSECRM